MKSTGAASLYAALAAIVAAENDRKVRPGGGGRRGGGGMERVLNSERIELMAYQQS